MKTIRKSALLKTSSNTDVQCGGGIISITGFGGADVAKKDIVSIQQIKYRVEVPQVVTLFGTSYTPVADKVYALQIGDPLRSVDGYEEQPYIYKYTTPTDLTQIGATAALQREAIHADLIRQINLETPLNRSAAVTVGTGSGITVTDSGGYYPVRSQSQTKMRGPNIVRPRTNADGSGFASTNWVLTTAAVTSYGVGAKLAQEAPVVDAVFGNAISGNLIDPPVATDGTYAVTGQKYDGFNITSLQRDALPTITDFFGYQLRVQTVYVDNGTGTDTTNLAGFITFEREMLRIALDAYRADASSMIDFFDQDIFLQGALGAAPATTGQQKLLSTGNAAWIYTQIGTQTIVGPVGSNTGLLLDQDLTDTEGAEYTPPLWTNCPKEFVVGKTPFMIIGRIVAGDWTDAAWLIGFHRKAANAPDFNDYTDLAAVGTLAANGDLITTQGILNNAATVSTSTGIIPVDAASVTVAVYVDINGLVTCKANGTTYPVYSTGTTPLILDATDIMVPFFRYANVSTGDPDLTIMRVAAVATNELVV
jgi:hypothetical protein